MSHEEDDDLNDFGARGSLSRIAAFGGFDRIARRNLYLMEQMAATVPPRPPYAPEEEDSEAHVAWLLWSHETGDARQRVDEHAAIVVIFACAAAESYINDVAARMLGETYFEVHIDRIELLGKWIIVPRLVNGHEIDRGGRCYELLRNLVRARNDLMHPKSRPLTREQIEKLRRAPEIAVLAKEAISALDQLRVEARTFDPHHQGDRVL